AANKICRCRKLRGSPESMGDLSYRFLALPYVPLAMVYWSGDEDFPAAAKVLFDESASHYLPTDALATLGGRLCNMILYAAGLLTQDPQHEHHDHHDHDH
ncbi:MAG: DUF3786 domain-containing protein, partial [Dehalococcoidales bacterium]|nr:DUF3786 domain-containing protein [Dehalococcoidales bacterium]